MYSKIPKNICRAAGFTLVEALFAVAIMGLLGIAVSALYASGTKSLDLISDRALLDSHLRSRLEMLISTDFYALGNGTEVLNVNGNTYTIKWSVGLIDLDGDSNLEINAKQIKVAIAEIPELSLTTVLTTPEGRVQKIS
jgi:type II secretory pathway pseudopilin PulG